MRIDSRSCQACCSCIPFCPVDAIRTTAGVCAIDYDECVECGVCLRSAVCPSGALFQDELIWPRTLRHLFSNPMSLHATTRVPGRGMEEVKTNDVTGRYRPGIAGIVLEVGRPGVGTRFRQVEIITRGMADIGLLIDPRCPLIPLMSDLATGTFLSEVLEEKVLSVIVSYDIPVSRLPGALTRLEEIQSRLSTVFSLGIICKTDAAGSVPALRSLREIRMSVSSHGKTNLGLGRPFCEALE